MKPNLQEYCLDLSNYKRLPTREVGVGDVLIGAENPIKVQSMTTTDTMDTQGTIAQSIKMIDAGCELVRITAPSIKEAENLKNIRIGLRNKGYKTPLIADIHFTPNAAEIAARIVEKVRINPGNFADKKQFQILEYSDKDYEDELNRISERFSPLVKICKEYGTAMRIGTNHGSLSDRILSRYGDTPLGMVESAMEFLRICEDLNYHEIILSMKASNTQVMVQAYRLLVKKMNGENMNYPLHLGVTEAGDGEDGRIKSAVGIGSLLEDGIGDTIRVSLTEEPEHEIPVAKHLANRYAKIDQNKKSTKKIKLPYDPYFHTRRKTLSVHNIGGENVPRVFSDLSGIKTITPENLAPLGYLYSVEEDKWHISDQAVDYVYIGNNQINFELPGLLMAIQNHSVWVDNSSSFPIFSIDEYNDNISKSKTLNFIHVKEKQLLPDLIHILQTDKKVVIILDYDDKYTIMSHRDFITDIILSGLRTPIIIQKDYANIPSSEFQLDSSTDLSSLLIDGLIDGLSLRSDIGQGLSNQTSFGILQASRLRISKTEYISCPSCGRTLFDLQSTTNEIRSVTDHLKGVKIGIMGCIVNGPGEMADADYGYVGTGVGKISLYKGQEVVKRNIPAAEAVNALIRLIKDHGDWVDPV
ncbi:4-hydroxy-3-methylbut-2-en-1-yl diphosphate synthase [bacterium]|nr:MAG: 4-hydroxy-3-methylbut-2-en-1-yl diphosphate synthase [bacterium]